MNKNQQTVLTMLKPKVKAFGFSKKVLKSIAAEIAGKLDIEEDASDEDVNAKINEAIEAVLPFMPFIQSQANSQFDEWKNAQTPDDEEEDDSKSKSNKSTKSEEKKSEEIPAWAQALIDSNKTLSERLTALQGEKLTDTRRARLEKLLKDTGTFGTRTLKSFGKMKFESDDDFDEFFSEVEEDLKSFNQERANAGLEKLGMPAGGVNTKKKDESKPEVLPEDEIKAIAKM